MKKTLLPLEQTAQAVAQRTGFMIHREIYRGTYYSAEKIRNLIYAGQYQGQAAVLKIYDDPRQTDEPRSLATFHAHNTSTWLTAPQLFASELTSTHSGWMIVEKLPVGGYFFSQPMAEVDRQEFLLVYREYRSHFPAQATRDLILAERLPAEEFTSARMSRWLGMVSGESSLFSDETIGVLVEGIKFVRSHLMGRPMVWCHGHFKPHEVYKTGTGKYYLLDFAHTQLFPEGYEFGFMVWADQLMTIDEHTTVDVLWQQLVEWEKAFAPIARDLGWKDFSSLARVSLVERIIGTVLADIGASDQTGAVKRMKIDLLLTVLQRLMQ